MVGLDNLANIPPAFARSRPRFVTLFHPERVLGPGLGVGVDDELWEICNIPPQNFYLLSGVTAREHWCFVKRQCLPARSLVCQSKCLCVSVLFTLTDPLTWCHPAVTDRRPSLALCQRCAGTLSLCRRRRGHE